MIRGISVSEAFREGFGVWTCDTRSEVLKLQKRISATSSKLGRKVKTRSYMSLDNSNDIPLVIYTVTTELTYTE